MNNACTVHVMYCRRGLFSYLACQVRTQPPAPDCSSWTVRHSKNARASEWKDNEQVRAIRTLVDEMIINGLDMNRMQKGCSKHLGMTSAGISLVRADEASARMTLRVTSLPGPSWSRPSQTVDEPP